MYMLNVIPPQSSRNKFLLDEYTELPKCYARVLMAVARGLGLPARRLVGSHTDAAPKHSLCYFSSVFE